MVKEGIIHDYDLKANNESSAKGQKCAVCDAEPMTFQWSDLNGEAMCTRCGCPYQLKNGTLEQRNSGQYPYLNLNPRYLEAIREYWKETGAWTYLGSCLGSAANESLEKLNKWMDLHHPKLLEGQE